MPRISSYTRRQAIVCAISFVSVVANEIAQRMVARELIGPHWIYGYISDFFAVPFTATLVTWMQGHRRHIWVMPLLFAVMFSLLELEGYHDPYDYVCYWTSAFLVMPVVAIKR